MKLFCPLFHYYLDKVIYSNEKKRGKKKEKEKKYRKVLPLLLLTLKSFLLHCFRRKSVRHIGCKSRFNLQVLF